MSGIGGWFESGREAPNAASIGTMAAALARFDGGVRKSAVASFGAAAVCGTPASEADVYRDERRLVAVCGQVSFADRALAALSAREGPARAIAEAHAASGADLFRKLSGPFAVAILDGVEGEALLAIDRMGIQPLAWTIAGNRLAFGSRLDVLALTPGIALRVDHQAIFDYVYHHAIPGPDCIYADVNRLLPGECLRYLDGRAATSRYWKMHFAEDVRRPFAALKSEFREVLQASVHKAAGGSTVGAFLSGGTDSSTIAGMLGAVGNGPARTYSIGFDAAGYDEMAYARIAARHFGTQHHEYYVTPDDILSAIPSIAQVHDQPFGNSSAIPAYYCAKAARADGVEVMLGGDGGDELFGGNERYAKQYLYSLYGDLPPALRTRVIEPAAFVLPAVGLIGKAQRYMRGASQPMPARYDNYNLLERFGAEQIFTPDFLATVDRESPRRRMEATYRDADAESLINRMLAFDFKYTLADNDLPKVSRSCELAGVGVRYPMLDDAVVAFSAGLAPGLKLKRTQLRWFFKEALRGFLPDAIIAKTKHGFGLPFGTWVRSHAPLRSLVMDSLSDLKERRIVHPNFIDDLTSRHLADHAAYYGTMVWVLMMLEQWFVHRGAGAPSAEAHTRAPTPDRNAES